MSSNQVLYRKYRPKRFEEIIGQEHIVRTLKNAVASDRIAHAYLFSGPRGTGKTTVARLIAKTLNCEEAELKKGDSCGVCAICAEFNGGKLIDLIEIDAASNRGIDEIRELREMTRFSPSRGKYKTYIIDEVHMLTKEAFNALLKTLEEPPSHSIFILATTEFEKVPETITSRCQHFEFRKISAAEIKTSLEQICRAERVKIDDASLHFLAVASDGSLRDAQSLLGQIIVGTDAGQTITLPYVRKYFGAPDAVAVREFLDAMAEKKPAVALGILNKLVDAGQDPDYFIKLIIDSLRSHLLAKFAPTQNIGEYGAEEAAEIKSRVEKFGEGEIERAIKIFIAAAEEMKISPIPHLPIELAIIETTK